ncbi:MAG: DegT/DnrJ/EryC1/StrS family aminotransferase [Verrucomicrobiales bacterium]
MDEFPFQDFRAPYRELKEELDAAYHRFMESGYLVAGAETHAFEKEYAESCQAAHCVGLSNGLDALHLALRALGVGPGDEVIVPSNTYIATWLAVHHVGATPVPVEPDPQTFNLDPQLLSLAVTKRTRAVLAVNLYGLPCDYGRIGKFATDNGLFFLTDNAQGHGGCWKNRPTGGIAPVECHSFYPSKNLGAFGEGGAVTTSDAAIADQLKVLRHYGSRERNHHEVAGFNARPDELQCAFLRVKLGHLADWQTRREGVATHYLRALKGCTNLVLPMVPEECVHGWHQFVIRHPERDRLRAHLTGLGIPTMIHYPVPPHLSGAFRHLNYVAGSFPVAEKLAAQILGLPINPHLTTHQVERVNESILSFV